jgi:hypothetical protein
MQEQASRGFGLRRSWIPLGDLSRDPVSLRVASRAPFDAHGDPRRLDGERAACEPPSVQDERFPRGLEAPGVELELRER